MAAPPAPAGRVLRVLVTGSRGWPWPDTVTRELDYQRARLTPADTLTVVHGHCREKNCPDAVAHRWAVRHETRPTPGLAAVREERHPADWTGPCTLDCDHGPRRKNRYGPGTTCPQAGPRRNQEMVDTRPDFCLVFLLNGSSGTLDCFNRILAARLTWKGCGTYTTDPPGPAHIQPAIPIQ